jgi:hypothetical protein
VPSGARSAFAVQPETHGEEIDYFVGRRLPTMLSRRGAHDIQATAETALYNESSLWAEYWRQTVIELRVQNWTICP